MVRKSKKRDAILECLRLTKDHPSAEWVYEKLKNIYPSLSLATVYRNLTQMKEAGLIRSMGVVCGKERFDANIRPHTHAICRICGKVLDVQDITLPENVSKKTEELTGFAISRADLSFSGVCQECREKGEK